MFACLFFFFVGLRLTKSAKSWQACTCTRVYIYYTYVLVGGLSCVCVRAFSSFCLFASILRLRCPRARVCVCLFFRVAGFPLGPARGLQKDHYASVSIVWQFEECLAFCQAFICGRTTHTHAHARRASTKYFIASCMYVYVYGCIYVICSMDEPAHFFLSFSLLTNNWQCGMFTDVAAGTTMARARAWVDQDICIIRI